MNLRLVIIAFLIQFTGSIFVSHAQPEITERELLQNLQNSKEDTNRVHLLLEAAIFYQSYPTFIKANSPFSYAATAESLTRKLDFKKGLGETYRTMAQVKIRHEKDTAASMDYTQKAIEIFRQLNNIDLWGESTYDMNLYYGLHPAGLNDRIKWTEAALSVFSRNNNLRKMADCNTQLGDLQLIAGRSLQGMATLRLALKQYQAAGWRHIHWIYDLLGYAYCTLGEYSEAEKFGQLAVKTMEDLKDFNGYTATIYNRMGITYQALGDYQKSKYYYDKGMDLAAAAHFVPAIYEIACNIGYLKKNMGEKREALAYLRTMMKKYPAPSEDLEMAMNSNLLLITTELKELNESKKLETTLRRMLDSTKTLGWEAQRKTHSALIQYYSATKQFELQKQYLTRYITISKNSHAFQELANAHLWAFRLDSIHGNYPTAIKNLQRYKALNDSLNNVIKGNQVMDLEILYEKEKKVNELASKERNITLLKKKAELKDIEIKKGNITRYVVIGMLILSIILIALLIYYSHNKRKSTKSLEQRQEEIEENNASLQTLLQEKEWLVKEIHHRVKNNFHIVMGLLNAQARFLTREESYGIMKSQHRIHAISLLHIKLYQSSSLSHINISTYAHELVEYLKTCYEVPYNIHFELNVQAIELNIAYAQPIGLILNEAITNCIKHSFDEKGGRIILTMRQYDGDKIYIEIYDNGFGLPPTFHLHRINTMGYNLIKRCCEELDAKIDLDNAEGTRLKITFALKPDQEIIFTDSPSL